LSPLEERRAKRFEMALRRLLGKACSVSKIFRMDRIRKLDLTSRCANIGQLYYFL
jgi:hypothetical protein